MGIFVWVVINNKCIGFFIILFFGNYIIVVLVKLVVFKEVNIFLFFGCFVK